MNHGLNRQQDFSTFSTAVMISGEKWKKVRMQLVFPVKACHDARYTDEGRVDDEHRI
jgi:hypothetical protein